MRYFKNLKNIVRTFYTIIQVWKFKESSLNGDIENALLFTYKYLSKPIPFWQLKEEICSFIKLVHERNPNAVLEIGTAGGGSLFMLSRVIPEDATLISIDLPYGQFGGGYPKYRIAIYKTFSKPKQNLKLVRLDSHSDESFIKIKQILNGKRLEVIFIDGDHTYDGVKKDFELYSQLLDNNGIIAFHDIVPGSEKVVGGVPKFWAEIKRNYRHKEFVKNWNQGGYGIGVIFFN